MTMTCIYSINSASACIAIYGSDVFSVICLNCTLQQALTLALPSTSAIKMQRPTLVTLLTWVVLLWVSCRAATIIPTFIYCVCGSVTCRTIQYSCTLWRWYANVRWYSSQWIQRVVGAGLLIGIPVLKNIDEKPWEKIIFWISLIIYLLCVVAGVLFNWLYKGYPSSCPVQNCNAPPSYNSSTTTHASG